MEELAWESISLMRKPAPRTDAARLGFAGAAFIMLKSALGAGLLSFPWAFHKAGGVSAAIGVEMVSLVFLISGLVILGHAASASGQSTYQGVVRQLCGSAAGRLCDGCFLFSLFMISVAFLVVMQDQLEKLSDSLSVMIWGSAEEGTPYSWYTDRHLALSALCLLVILPLSLPKEIAIQKFTSVLGTLAATYLTVAVVVRYYLREEPADSPQYGASKNSWASTFSVMPTICFGFQCHEAAVAIYSSLENKALPHWALISVVSMLLCLFIYSLTGIFGYMTFGKDVAADILMSYPGDDLVMIVARLLFGVSIITIYPITLLLGRSVLEDLLQCAWGLRRAVSQVYEKHAHAGLTVAWIAATLLISIFVPNISDIISIIGSISAFFIFIFPGLCLMFSMQSVPVSPTTRVALTSWGTITLLCGVFIFAQSIAIAIMHLLTKF